MTDTTGDAAATDAAADAIEMTLPALPVPRTAEPKTAFGRWLHEGEVHGEAHSTAGRQSWHRVLWLTGVDYFSTLGYQPGIALLAAGAIAPIATSVLVLVTLIGAVPVYQQVAWRSFAGQGSIAMLETLLKGWSGKLLVLVLLGFAATDFVITMTLSAADAAQHAVENPLLHDALGEHQIAFTLIFLGVLAGVFLKGFREAIHVAIAIAVPYLLLNLVVLVWGCIQIAGHPELLGDWTRALQLHGDWTNLALVSVLLFPRLALGLSGFETGVAVMPQIDGGPEDPASARPVGVIRATRRMLTCAALIMCVLLILSSFVTALLVPPEAFALDGKASGRVISWLAHRDMGHVFGSIYDISTILILGFAGASAMAGLLSLVPRYMPRFGMAPRWTAYRRPMVLLLFGIAVLVTLVFRASVEAQGGAYATGVLALMLSAGFAVALDLWREARDEESMHARFAGRLHSLYFWVITAVFLYAFVDNVAERPAGVIIASLFIVSILVLGGISRTLRSTELRVSAVRLPDEDSARLWKELVKARVNLVPLRGSLSWARTRKTEELREHYRLDGPVAFLHVALMDNRSEFLAPIAVEVRREGRDYVVLVSGAIAIANTIAYLSELIHPRSLFLGLTVRNQMTQSFRYLVFGEGEVGLMVYKILLRYWEWTERREGDRPQLFLMGDTVPR